MTPGIRTTLALALSAGLLGGAAAAQAQGVKVVAPGSEVTVSANEDGSGVNVHRGPAKLLAAAPAAPTPIAYIDGRKVRLDRLEPADGWFMDRSGDDLVLVHCYTRKSIYVGGKRRIHCSAREY